MKKFLGRDRKKSPNSPGDSNPYAQEPADDPYASQNSSGKVLVSNPGGLPSGPRAGRAPGVGLPSGPAPRNNTPSMASSMNTPPPSYRSQQPPRPPQQHQQQQNTGYGSDRYGASGGYGSSNRYGDGGGYGSGGARGPQNDGPAGGRRPGGYGGLGGSDGDDADGREALFGGAKERVQNAPPPGRAPNAGGYAAPAGGGYGGAPSSGPAGNKYGGYGEERELTEEEQIKLEERDLAREIDQERDATVDTGHRILGIINSTIETANGTLQNMAQQDERLRNTERNLDLARVHNRTAEEKTKELKYYNRSLWNPGNPFMTKSKQAERERKFMEEQEKDRTRREATLRDAHQSQAQYERDMREIQDTMNNRRALGLSATQAAASNNKFVFDESDEEDDNPENMALRADRRAKEHEINDVIMPQMEAGVATLNQIARNFQPRIEESNRLIDRIGEKSDQVDSGIVTNRRKLDAIMR